MNTKGMGTGTPHWLSAFPRLASIADAGWMEALNAAREIIVPAGLQVVREQQPCRDFLLIASGCVRVYKVSSSGREIMLYHTRAGEVCILTLGTLLEGTDYFANAVTEEDVRAVMIPAAQFHAAMAHSDDFRSFILSELSHRLRKLIALSNRSRSNPWNCVWLACWANCSGRARHSTSTSPTRNWRAVSVVRGWLRADF